MCGRYATTRSSADLSRLFEASDETGGLGLAADYNVAPTDPVPIVRARTDQSAHLTPRGDPDRSPTGRALSLSRWGLVPHWAPDARGAARMINARAETVATSPAFAPSFANRRCLLPADGWYEWLPAPTAGGRKQAYFMTPKDGGILAFAGIWARWTDRLTCSIVTTAAIGELASIHDRMPLVLPPERWALWLRGASDPATLLVPPPDAFLATLEIRPVGPAVGDVRNDGPGLVARVDAPPPDLNAGSSQLF